MSTLRLLRQRQFLPFFLTQFAGAMNDNLFKNALLILVAYQVASEGQAGLLINLAAGLFILPFLLFSPVAGQIADRYDKARVMRTVKAAEIGIMLVGAGGFYLQSLPLLYATLFGMGVHSAFFGPVKYSILPQALRQDELMDGNALVEMGTFLAILIGTIGGGLLAGGHDANALALGVLGVALFGFFAVRWVPAAPSAAPDLRLNWNPWSQSVAMTRLVRTQKTVLSAVMAISWYWYFGATVLAQLPGFTKYFLHGNETVVTLLLADFAVAISIGSLLCARLSRGHIETGLVLFGAVGMSVFTGALFWLDYGVTDAAAASVAPMAPMAPMALWQSPHGGSFLLAVAALGLTGVCSSFFIVPLYALIQERSAPQLRSRVIAINNVYNSLFMVGSALVGMGLFAIGGDTLHLLMVTAVLNLGFAAMLVWVNPEYWRRAKGFIVRG